MLDLRQDSNMTFGGVQGFTRKPGTPFQDDQGNFAGIVHQERGLTYALFQNAGHFVAQSVPGAVRPRTLILSPPQLSCP